VAVGFIKTLATIIYKWHCLGMKNTFTLYALFILRVVLGGHTKGELEWNIQ